MSEEGKEAEETTQCVEECVHFSVCVCSGGQVVPPNINEREKEGNEVKDNSVCLSSHGDLLKWHGESH